MKVIGLTGGIATGKSTVSQILIRQGYDVIDADSIVRELQSVGSPLMGKISNSFGTTVLHKDGSLNRGALGKIIFGNDDARRQLDAIMYPVIRAEFEQRIGLLQTDVLFLDVPLLFEAGFDDMTDVNLVINASTQMQLMRLMSRDGFTREEAQSRINSQMPISEKIARANFVIDNSGDFYELEENVERFLEEILR